MKNLKGSNSLLLLECPNKKKSCCPEFATQDVYLTFIKNVYEYRRL